MALGGDCGYAATPPFGTPSTRSRHDPDWLVVGAWIYVALRVVHSVIHCTSNRVMQRLAAFMGSVVLLVGL